MGKKKKLLEQFFPEARFPDEDFWEKDGTPIHKGPKKRQDMDYTSGRHYGASDEHDAIRAAQRPKNPDLRDHFSKTFDEYKAEIDKAARRMYGKDYKSIIDDAFENPGLTDNAIQEMWDAFYTDHEALGEIGFLFDTAKDANGASGYPGLSSPGYFSHPKEDYDDGSGSTVPRRSRAVDAGKDGLIY